MSWPADIPIDSVVAIYSAANTPAYLFKRLRQLGEVQQVAGRFSVARLADEIGEVLQQQVRTTAQIAATYGFLAAMSLREYGEWQGVVGELDLRVLDWGEQFRTLLKASAIPTVVTDLEQAPLVRPGLQIGDAGELMTAVPPPVQRIVLTDQ